MILLVAAAACLNPSCDIAAAASLRCRGKTGVYYELSANTLCLNDKIDPQGELLRQISAQPLRSGVLVVLKSDGGEVLNAIAIAQYLEKYSYRVIVDGICASACAQFLFMGAKTKTIIDDGLVAMHGGPLTNEQIDASKHRDETKQNLKKSSIEFRNFYRERRINIRMTDSFPQNLLDRLAKGEMAFWIPNEHDFERFGVRNIRYCNAKYRDPDKIGKD